MSRSIWAEGPARTVVQLSTLEPSIKTWTNQLDLGRAKDRSKKMWGDHIFHFSAPQRKSCFWISNAYPITVINKYFSHEWMYERMGEVPSLLFLQTGIGEGLDKNIFLGNPIKYTEHMSVLLVQIKAMTEGMLHARFFVILCWDFVVLAISCPENLLIKWS